MSSPKTLYDKIVDEHRILSFDESSEADERLLLYIDRTVLNEYTSPQAFSGLRAAGRTPWRPAASLGVVDHVNSTNPDPGAGALDDGARRQIEYLSENGRDFGIEIFDLFDPRQGIEHVVMPELGMVLPGMVIAAGDSHSTTYGAFGVVGFGIGTSDIEHLLATQTLVYRRLKTMRVAVDGRLAPGVTAKDLIMEVIRRIGADGAAGHAVEFAGTAIEALGVEARMTVCNMAVECGARVALMAPDDKVIDYIAGCPRAPSAELLAQARTEWSSLRSDPDARFNKEIALDASEVPPMVSWGTSPDQSLAITQSVPDPEDIPAARRADAVRALAYMGLAPNTPLQDIAIDRAFIGSCTNARLSDLRDAAEILKGRKVAPGVRAMISPGSSNVRRAAEAEGIDRIFIDAGFEWRRSGCSLCLAMNDDSLAPGERCASSTNRNFEGRQGIGGRTHLMSPAMVAAAAVTGKLVDVRSLAATGAL
ncbi:3-isopropylmalate dehydratase large subunit [Sphingopyxis sp. USTB-05]|jgi:3-isopropylmalate/(R)-2-methylmalate dehydratase large subunit|uniref:3-isopropylmalate dehydratase large subunit n=1 Tax=Sphingopyxis sp. USTB-05 TaxID=2830667 RepID=UPI0020790666|nr:3-isopropylmalate dehydratase large subunit [Sphingopyxis sp. USTB-05]USI77807.1 3-isopropylmalate dehydratase large subunit [Sphingopyxis sp. USTB-05]